jgi:hypothetical protein
MDLGSGQSSSSIHPDLPLAILTIQTYAAIPLPYPVNISRALRQDRQGRQFFAARVKKTFASTPWQVIALKWAPAAISKLRFAAPLAFQRAELSISATAWRG